MISKEDLYYRILDYLIKYHKPNTVIDSAKMFQTLGLDEYVPHANEMVKELQNKNFVETMTFHAGKTAIMGYTINAKYYVEDYEKAITIQKMREDSIIAKQNDNMLDIFISHSSANQEVVKHFIELLIKAFKIDESKIRCTSVPGYKLPSGVNVDSTLKKEIIDSKVFIGFITEESLVSTYVLFELGARWGTDLGFRLINIDGSLFGKLKAPLSNHHISNISERSELYQILNELKDDLGYNPYNSNAIESNVHQLLELIGSLNEVTLEKEALHGKSTDEYSLIEMDILKSADGKNDGIIRIIKTKDGTTIQCGQKVFISSDNHKEIQKVKGAIDSLLNKGFLQSYRGSDKRFEFTDITYSYVEGFKKI